MLENIKSTVHKLLFSVLGYHMRSDEIESLQHVLQGTVTGKSRKFLNDEPTDGRLIFASGPGYISNNSHRRT